MRSSASGRTADLRALGQVWLERPRDDRAFEQARQALERAAASTERRQRRVTLYGRALLQDDENEAAEHTLAAATSRYPIEPAAFLLYGPPRKGRTIWMPLATP